MQDQQSWPQPRVVARVRSNNSLLNTSHNGSATGSPTVRHQPYGNAFGQPQPRSSGSPFGSLNNSINGNPLSPPPPPAGAGGNSGSFSHNGAPLPPPAVPLSQNTKQSPNSQSYDSQPNNSNHDGSGRNLATQRMMEGYGFGAPARSARGYNQQQIHQHLNGSNSTNGGPNGSPLIDGSQSRNPYSQPPLPSSQHPIGGSPYGGPSTPTYPHSNNNSFNHQGGNSFSNNPYASTASHAANNNSFQGPPSTGYNHTIPPPPHAHNGSYYAGQSYMKQPPPPLQPYGQQPYGNTTGARPPTYTNSNHHGPYNNAPNFQSGPYPPQPPYVPTGSRDNHHAEGNNRSVGNNQKVSHPYDHPNQNYPSYYQTQQQQPAPSYHNKSSQASSHRANLSPTPQAMRGRSDSLGSLGSVGVAMADFDASDARSQGPGTPNSLSGTFVLGSGSNPLPFDSPSDQHNPLKDKWDRRRRVHRQHLGKAVIFPSEVVTVRNATEIAAMVDDIKADVTLAHRLLKEAQIRGEKELADKAAGRVPSSRSDPNEETASQDAEMGSGGEDSDTDSGDESDKVSASTARTLSSSVAAAMGRRTPHSTIEPRSTRKPAPPPGHKSFRECLRLRQRTFVAIHLIGVDSSKLSNLYLILIATPTITYIIDMTEMKPEDFRACKLAELFEDPEITKITFDCRPDVEVLQRQFGVVLKGVCDLQVMATLSISPRGQFMIGRKAMFQRLFLLSPQDEELKEKITTTGIPTQAIPNVGQFPAPAVECCIIDLKYLFVAFFMLDYYEGGGRTIGDQRVQNTLAGYYNKSTMRDF